MFNIIKKEITALILLFFLFFFGLCHCIAWNLKATHEKAVYESQFSTNPQVEPDGFFLAMTTGGKERKYRIKTRMVKPVRD